MTDDRELTELISHLLEENRKLRAVVAAVRRFGDFDVETAKALKELEKI